MKRIAVIVTVVCLSGVVALAAPPEICRTQGGNTKTVWGTGFAPGATEAYVGSVKFDEKAAWAALTVADYKGRDLLPAEPTANAQKINILSADPRGWVMAVEFYSHYNAEGFYDARAGEDILWVKNAAGFSKPWLAHSAQPWWVNPARAQPGQKIRIFGRNMNGRLAALREIGSTEVQKVKITGSGRHAMYEVEAVLPDDVKAGEYELFAHNGTGGAAGWGGPLKLTIRAPQNKVKKYLNAKEYGAQGDGVADDTDALRRVLETAARDGAHVLLPAGCYALSQTLELPVGVSIKGVGMGATTLQVLAEKPMQGGWPRAAEFEGYAHDWYPSLKDGSAAPMVWMRHNSSLSDLSLQYGPGVAFGVLVARGKGVAEDIRIERVRIVANQQSASWVPSVPVFLAGNTYGLVIADNEFTGLGAIDCPANSHTQAYIGRNDFRCSPPHVVNTIFLRGFKDSIIENNYSAFGLRNFSCQLGTKLGKHENPEKQPDAGVSSYHVALMGNMFYNNSPRRHNDGETMYESGSAFWKGNVMKAEAKSVTVAGEPFGCDMSEAYVLILDGRGLGQYRQVLSNTKSALLLDRPWDLIPDSSTYCMVGAFFADTLWIDNTEEHTANWTGFWGNNVGHVIDGHVLRDGVGFYLWAWDNENLSAVAFVDIIGSRTIERGGIRFVGTPVFGNTVRFCEIVDFRYRPSFHIQPSWLQRDAESSLGTQTPDGPSGLQDDSVGISLNSAVRFKGVPESAPLNGWNIIEANHIFNGAKGIVIQSEAQATILKRNTINVEKSKIVDKSKKAIIVQ